MISKNVFNLVILFVLFGCAGQKSQSANRKIASIEMPALQSDLKTKEKKPVLTKERKVSSLTDDFSWVDDLKFDKITSIPYSLNQDFYNFNFIDSGAFALGRESLMSFDSGKQEEILKSSQNPLIQLDVKCQLGKIDDALKEADSLYASHKINPEYWNVLGNCYYLKLDLAKAILFYNKSRDLDKNYVPPINNLGVIYEKQNRYQKALAAFKLATDINAFALTPSYNLSYLYLKFGMIDKALPIITGLNKKSPQDIEINLALAAAYVISGKFQEAVSIYSRFDNETIGRASVGLNYAIALAMLNRPKDARTVFQYVKNIPPRFSAYAEKVQGLIGN